MYKNLLLDPVFILGLALRLVLLMIMAPNAVTTWYVPFLETSVSQVTFDPWLLWLNNEGVTNAFPYGYAMWLSFLPLTSVASLLELPVLYAYYATLVLADLGMLIVLNRLVSERTRLLLVTYWLSPIVILATYILGHNDLIPALLLVLAVLCIRESKLGLAGSLLAIAISAKLSMVVALPFFAIYLFNNRALRQNIREFSIGFVLFALAFGAPFLTSPSGTLMLLGNPEMMKVYQITLDFGNRFSIYLVPLTYLALLYSTWRIRRLNFDIFHATLGISFLMIVLLTPAAPGWFLWCMPFLCLYQSASGLRAAGITGIFSILYVVTTLLTTKVQLSNGYLFDLNDLIIDSEPLGHMSKSLLHTVMLATGAVLAIRMWREAVGDNDYFRLTRKPFSIGITGDSGSGKDTFVEALKGLIGNHSLVHLSGDNYHLWDRQKPMWQVMTPLNPMANDLERFSNDLVSLVDGKMVSLKHYDHKTGKMSKSRITRSNDFIIASGLHALYFPILRECYNLKIYLDIDEGLRRLFKLQRDVKERGHSIEHVVSSLEKRESDAQRFIRPQIRHADLIFSLQPVDRESVITDKDTKPPQLKLVVKTRQSFNEWSLHRVLVGVCGMHVDLTLNNDNDEMEIAIEGDASENDIALAAKILCPRVLEFLDLVPRWQSGTLGLMQLVTLSHVNQALTMRII